MCFICSSLCTFLLNKWLLKMVIFYISLFYVLKDALDALGLVRFISWRCKENCENVLAWQQAAARIGMKRSAASFQWLSERKVFVLLKIHRLVVNALLKSNQVNDMEGGSLLGFEDIGSGSNVIDEQYGFDEATSSRTTLRVFETTYPMVSFGSGDLKCVMQKVFALLLAEFRKLGATIIFPKFSKVIKDTRKFSVPTARTYCDSLLKTLQNRELFEWIELEPVDFIRGMPVLID
ncbi:hypothetical protein K2173_015206 [Erythroxylum novogranatense]|uniref:DNA polymerase epsilon catalytic subunit n=1 Tax=Erythroxylum novogranatense TaxID=1862640 RepID=A0AAV8T2K1_9ROSI|nr:hypothetical protein K2173_015206 [Erythroxylum novogranatense]